MSAEIKTKAKVRVRLRYDNSSRWDPFFGGDFGGREWNEFVSRTQVEGERVNERRRGRSKIRSQLQPIKRATSGVGGSSSSSRTGEKQTCGSDSYARQSFKSLAEGVHAKRGRKRKDPKRGERREECDGD